jgi:methyl-accepting chemotaxis protein
VGGVNQSLVAAEGTINHLATKDMTSLMDSKKHVEDMMVEIGKLNKTIESNGVELNLIGVRVEQNVAMAVSTLQFQDMSSQLIGYAQLRLTALQEVANELGKGTEQLNSHEYLQRLAVYNQSLHQHIVSLEEQKSHPVAQKNINTGEIELF